MFTCLLPLGWIECLKHTHRDLHTCNTHSPSHIFIGSSIPLYHHPCYPILHRVKCFVLRRSMLGMPHRLIPVCVMSVLSPYHGHYYNTNPMPTDFFYHQACFSSRYLSMLRKPLCFKSVGHGQSDCNIPSSSSIMLR